MSTEEIESRILEFLREELRMDATDLTRESELVSTGLLDSTDLVRLCAHLERSFDIEVPDEDVNADNFDSVILAAKYVQARAG